jgi:hypothetical protein
MPRPKKGSRVSYIGPYAPECTYRYPPGTVVAFRDYGMTVTVLLDKAESETEDLFADWLVDEIEPA